MSAEQDAGKNGKKLYSIIGFGVLLAVASGYLLLSWIGKDRTGTDSCRQSQRHSLKRHICHN